VDVGGEGVAKSLGDTGAGLVVDLLKDRADGTETGRVAEQVLLGERAGDIDRADVDAGPAALFEDAAHAIGVGERELAGGIGLSRREAREERGGGALGGRHEGILGGTAPGEEVEAGVFAGGAAEVLEGADGVVEEHDAEAGDDGVEARGLEGVALGVGEEKGRGRAFADGAGAGCIDKGLGDVDAGTGTAEAALQGEGDGARSTADIEDGAGGDGVYEEVLERLEHLVERFLGVYPGVAGGAVPEDAIGVSHDLSWIVPLQVDLRSRKKILDIGEVAERAGVPPSTLRFYEEKGLIRPVGRRGLRRLFEAEVVERLALISLGRAAGFSLDEIGRLLDGGIDRELLAGKAKELDRTIRRLTAMRDGLRHAAACPAPSHMECPKFRRYLRAAVSGAIGRRGKE
jgi:DNA-binding transcriptional MerR regulator